MALCAECLLKEQPGWISRYRKGSALLALFGVGTFTLPDSLPAIAAQGLFFAILFPWIVWPLIAVSRSIPRP